MSILDVLNPIKAIGDLANSIIGKFVADPNEKLQLQQKVLDASTALSMKAMELQSQLTDAQSKVITAEITSQSWLARNWRPLLMLTFTFIVAWNYIIVPIVGATPAIIPPDMWTLMKIGVGGYIVGRSAEKVVTNLKANGSLSGTGPE